VTLPVGSPTALLAQFYGVGRALLPDTRVQFRFEDVDPAELDERPDLAIHFGEPLSSDVRVAMQVVVLREWIVAGSGYLAARGIPRTIDDLAEHDLLSWVGAGRGATEWPLLGGGRVAVRPRASSTSIELLRQLASRDQGLVLAPDGELANELVPSDALRVVLDDVIGRSVPVSLSVSRAILKAPGMEALLLMTRRFLDRV
jgi:DNA-binding transcriptional LysR family regulator